MNLQLSTQRELTVMSSYPREFLGYDTLPRKLFHAYCILEIP